jgi:hypothetical protein
MPRCPTPKKRGFRNELDAKLALLSTQRSRSSRRDENRLYQCPCGRWHLSTSWRTKL